VNDNIKLTSFAEGVWFARDSYRLFGVDLGTKMTVVRLANEKLLIYSPIKINDSLRLQLSALGDPAYIVVPSILHNLHAEQWYSAFPHSTVYCAQGAKIRIKGKSLKPGESYPWEDQLITIFIDGMPKVNEWVFVHKKSRTLIVCDLLFNVTEPQNFLARQLLKLYGIYNRSAITPLYKLMIKNRDAFDQSVAKLKSCHFDKIIVAHGNNINEQGHSIFLKACQP